MLFMYLKHVITAGILSAALAIGPGAAFAQTSGSTSGTSGTSSQGTSSQGTSSQGTSSQGTSSQGTSSTGSQSGTTTSSTTSSGQRQGGSGGSGADQEAVRQHLSAAREALAELTKLPAASQLQGEQRQQVAQLISDFNSFATATTDWRPKYDTIDHELDQILGMDASAGASGSASGSAAGAGVSGSGSASTGTTADAAASGNTASGASGAVGTSGAAGSLDPTIIAKLREVRTHLDGFEEASGDPTFVVEKIEKILDQAAGGASAGGAVGTAGSSDSAAGGSVTLTATQVQEVRRQLETIKAAAKR
jgi:hypothetical protein